MVDKKTEKIRVSISNSIVIVTIKSLTITLVKTIQRIDFSNKKYITQVQG